MLGDRELFSHTYVTQWSLEAAWGAEANEYTKYYDIGRETGAGRGAAVLELL